MSSVAVQLIHNDPYIDQCGYCDDGIQGDQYCRYCGGDGVEVFDLSSLATLAHNLAVAGALCASFRAGDNFGFHMGSDESQCTCQWSPNAHGDAYKGTTRCEQELLEEDDGYHGEIDDLYDSNYEDCP